MIGILEAVFLGFIQGLTEWFPVSSSGHLALFQNLMGLEVPVLYDIYLHLGTLIVLLAFFWKEIKDIFADLLRLDFKSENSKLAGLIVIGLAVTSVIGLVFHDQFSAMFGNLLYVGIAFLFTGVILALSGMVKRGYRKVNFLDSVLIGLFQGISLIPGVSRSGATIGIGLFRGVDRIKVAKFSFLLSMPAIIGASIVESFGMSQLAFPFLVENLSAVIFGVLASAVTGYVCLRWLMKLIESGKFHYFAYYAFAAGIVTILLSIA